MNVSKLVLAVIWLLSIAAFAIPESTLSTLGQVVFWLLAAAHSIECAVFFPVLRKAPGPLPRHLLHTFVFGILYVQEVRALASESSAPPGE